MGQSCCRLYNAQTPEKTRLTFLFLVKIWYFFIDNVYEFRHFIVYYFLSLIFVIFLIYVFHKIFILALSYISTNCKNV